jgi:hypothetical protein
MALDNDKMVTGIKALENRIWERIRAVEVKNAN